MTVLADNEMLQHVIMNLSLNAIQSMSEWAARGIRSFAYRQAIFRNGPWDQQHGVYQGKRYSTRYTGRDTAQDLRSILYDPAGWTGLGLSIVQRIVDGLG